MEYKEYVKEIEYLKDKYGFDSYEVLMLQIAATFESNNMSFNKLKEEYIDRAFKLQK